MIRFVTSYFDPNRLHSSYLVLITLALLVLAVGALYSLGVIEWVLRFGSLVVRVSIRNGFALWERFLSWASWAVFLAIVFCLLALGITLGDWLPGLRIVCGLLPLFMGVIACLAYMSIDLERYEVRRGYKAVYKPSKGQELAVNLAHYGPQVRAPLLAAATVGMLGGFALLNQGIYETLGAHWYTVEDEIGAPGFADFLAYILVHLLGIIDVLDLAASHHFLRVPLIHPNLWPSSTLLTSFKAFFTLVLLQQIFASVRQGKLLVETITDFWSPHEPIHDRARNALPQYGAMAIGPLLLSLRTVQSLTLEQREQLPLILETIGPSTIPALLRHLHDPHEHVRSIAVAALGRLKALGAIRTLTTLAHDPSDMVRQSLAETLGTLGSAATQPSRKPRRFRFGPSPWRRGFGWLFPGTQVKPVKQKPDKPVALAVATLQAALSDVVPAVRTQAAVALGRIGPRAAASAAALIQLLTDTDETVRCQAADALSKVGGDEAATVAALMTLLTEASAAIKAAAAQALCALKTAAAPAANALVPLLQDRDETVRTAAAEALARIGPLNGTTKKSLVGGLASPDNVVRAQTAEALGTIGAAAASSATALVAAMKDDNDLVRARAVEALGKIGESAAVAVPGLMRALRDQDHGVSALAAEALGQMGESADSAVPALIYSLQHLNPQVRGNAAEALGRLKASAAIARLALEKAAHDADGVVRSQATRSLGAIGPATPTSTEVVLAGLEDADPLVRAAAVECLGLWGEASDAALTRLLPLLEDANDQVKVEAVKVLPRLAGPTPPVIDALCRRLLEDDSTWVQVHAALSLGTLGSAAAAAGGPLLHVVQTGEASVREQAMRAIAMIQPPEILAAFTAGLKDSNADIRKVASGGWMKAPSIPEEVVPLLIVALRDSELQVRANAAHALARLDTLPAEAVPLLIDCTTDASDGLRMNAALALQQAPPAVTHDAMRLLLDDTNLRIRLIAASSILPTDPTDAKAGLVLTAALNDSSVRVRQAALELVDTLGMSSAGVTTPVS